MFECLFETRQLSAIGTNVVDDTEDITIPVSVVDCSKYLTEDECVAPCHWWGGACHDKPEEEEFPWWMVIAAVGGAVVVIGIMFALKGR